MARIGGETMKSKLNFPIVVGISLVVGPSLGGLLGLLIVHFGVYGLLFATWFIGAILVGYGVWSNVGK